MLAMSERRKCVVWSSESDENLCAEYEPMHTIIDIMRYQFFAHYALFSLT